MVNSSFLDIFVIHLHIYMQNSLLIIYLLFIAFNWSYVAIMYVQDLKYKFLVLILFFTFVMYLRYKDILLIILNLTVQIHFLSLLKMHI